MTFEQFAERAVPTVSPVFPGAMVTCKETTAEDGFVVWWIEALGTGDVKRTFACAAQSTVDATDERVWEQIRQAAEREKAKRPDLWDK